MTKNEARKKATELVSKLTLEEKMAQLMYTAPAIERLGINAHNWWCEASHGVARTGTATVFPHAIALASTFDPELINKVADVISTEGRAKYNAHREYNDHDIFKGLTFWAPNINIFRDPRWGRGQETFGEDPYLTATLGVKYINGLQGNGEFLKASACSKHFAVHSGPESLRHSFNAEVSGHDLWETYLPAFEKTVKSGVTGVMGAYNSTNGSPCCANKTLLVDILRKKWNFDGYVVSDCGAIKDIYESHRYVDTPAEAAGVAMAATCDLNCGWVYENLMDAYESDYVTEEQITEANVRLFTIRYMLGEFEKNIPYADITLDKLDCKEHKDLNLSTALDSIVLLKNEKNYLPIDKNTEKKIAVIGPNGMSITALEGNYNGTASEYVTVADGIRKVFDKARVTVEKGCQYCTEMLNSWDGFAYMISDGVAAAKNADITVLCLGLDRSVEGEETGKNDEYSVGGDKSILYLPKTQQKLAEAICDVCDNVVVVMMCGSSIDPGEKLRKHAKAIIQAWYPGALGGLAIAKLMSGEYSPNARLPITIYSGDYKLPEFTDYAMKGKTYRYMENDALYPFGYGLSYTKFEYSDAKIESVDENTVKLSVDIKNTGAISGKEKAQVYARYTDNRVPTPNFQLCSLNVLDIEAGRSKKAEFTIDRYWIKAVLENGERAEPNGMIELYVGGHQPDKVSNELTGYECLKINLK